MSRPWLPDSVLEIQRRRPRRHGAALRWLGLAVGFFLVVLGIAGAWH